MGHRVVEQGPSQNQSSVLFSLKELMGLEETRVEEERQAATLEAERREEARRRAEVESARQAEEALAREEAQKAEEARLVREEAARHEALRLAAVERARLEALQNARATEQKLANDHHARLLELERDGEKKKLRRNIIVLAAGAVLVLGTGLGIYFGKMRPEAFAERERIQAEANRISAENARLAKESGLAQDEIDRLRREQSEIKPVAAPAPVETVTAKPFTHGLVPTAAPTVDPCKNKPKTHDPMDPCAS